MSRKTVSLFTKVKKAILANPESYNQEIPSWGRKPNKDNPACIIGWARYFLPKGTDHYDLKSYGLTKWQYYALYDACYWPNKFYDADRDGPDWSNITASTAAKRIDYFIKTGK